MTTLDDAIALLRALADDPAQLADIPEEQRRALLEAAGRLSRPDRDARRALHRAHRKNDREKTRRADEDKLAKAGIRVLRAQPVFPTPPRLIELGDGAPDAEQLNTPRSCYVCKEPFATVHHHYDAMCERCGDLNFERRNATFPLPGRVALITGARVKIGYHAAIKLLRAGCEVIVTTRFPRDAAERYARESDYGEWRDRLHVYGIDLRHTPSVERLCQHVEAKFPRLDFLLNNACQTVRRPPGFYRHLLEKEEQTALPAGVVSLVPSEDDPAMFPAGQLDADLQQRDLRAHNSWRLRLHEVPTIELLEVHLVNAVAPFVLDAKLKPLMLRVPTRDKHIVNVSAMEGQFYRAFKTDKHPHTNMAKAALNMLTRTSAVDYARDGIHMNSVDTGWITDEDPAPTSAKKAEQQGREFQPPLDVVDGAARIVAPIFEGFATGTHRYGMFFKNYLPEPW